MLTLHKQLLAYLTQLLHGCFRQVLIVESTFQPLIDVGILGKPGWPRSGWLLALRHIFRLEIGRVTSREPSVNKLMSETKTNVRLMFCFANHGASSESLYSCSGSILKKVWLVLMSVNARQKVLYYDKIRHSSRYSFHVLVGILYSAPDL